MRPPWFSEDQVALQKDGTVTISFVCNGQPGVLRTFYDTETCVARRLCGSHLRRRSKSILFLFQERIKRICRLSCCLRKGEARETIQHAIDPDVYVLVTSWR
jgi:hypothetical protein